MRLPPVPHMVVYQSGDIPKRIERCPMRACTVDEDGATSCQHLACPHCGVGPPILLQPDDVFYCDVCTRRFRPFELPV